MKINIHLVQITSSMKISSYAKLVLYKDEYHGRKVWIYNFLRLILHGMIKMNMEVAIVYAYVVSS